MRASSSEAAIELGEQGAAGEEFGLARLGRDEDAHRAARPEQPRENDVGIEDEPRLAARGALPLRAIGGDPGFDLLRAEGLDAGGGDPGARFGEALRRVQDVPQAKRVPLVHSGRASASTRSRM
jgi:hypothetical protein